MIGWILSLVTGCVLIDDDDRAARAALYDEPTDWNCGLDGDTGDSSGASPPGASVLFGRPADGETLSGNVLIELNISNFALDDPYDQDEDGDGHYHFYVDLEGNIGEDFEAAFETSSYLTGLELNTDMFGVDSGCHQLMVRLHGHNHEIFDPVTYDIIEVEIQNP